MRRKKSATADELFPSLAGQGMIALDLETRDEDLRESGPGYHRGDTFVAGLAVATEAGFRRYYPVRHEAGDNLDPARVFGWFAEQAALPVAKVGSNLSYDLGFLEEKEGIRPVGPFYDTQIAEPLLDENRFQYGIDALGRDYLGLGKNDDELREYLAIRFGKKNPMRYIWRAPSDMVDRYAVADVDRSLRVFAQQRPKLEAEGLWPLFLLESKLMPMLVAMRRRGVRVDVGRAEEMDRVLTAKLAELDRRLTDLVGATVEVWAAASVEAAFLAVGVTDYPRTAKTRAASFTGDWLEKCQHPLAELLLEARKVDKLRGTFIRGQILGAAYRGRVHCQFNQLRGEGKGAVSGRLSAEKPNLQFIPKRTAEGKKIREAFLPDLGEDWGAIDYSQVEVRFAVHDGVRMGFRGAAELAQRYRDDPQADVYQDFATSVGTTRWRSKTIVLAILYGEGVAKLARQLELDLPEADQLYRKFNREVPFFKQLATSATDLAQRTGVVTTLLGRKRRFESWVVKRRVDGQLLDVYLPHRVLGARRAHTHAAFNARDQGSCADILKKAMVNIWESGVCGVLGPPLLTVHDELGFSVPRTPEGREAFAEAIRLMETTVRLEVPLRVNSGTGDNWGVLE